MRVELGPGSYGFGFLAGILSLLSPCVLPLVPIVVGTAVAAHPLGALALAAGLALSFTSVGLFAATIGYLDRPRCRMVPQCCRGPAGWLRRHLAERAVATATSPAQRRRSARSATVCSAG